MRWPGFLVTGLCLISSVVAQEDAEFWLRMASRYEISREYALEELSLNKVLRLDPRNERAKNRLKELGTIRQSQQGLYSERFSQMEETLRQDPGQSRELQEVQESVTTESTAQKISVYEERLKQPSLTEGQKGRLREILARLYFDQGIVHVEADRLKPAIESFERSVHYDQKFQLSHYELGYLYFRIRELQRGIDSLEKFVNLQPDGVLSQNVRETLLSQYIKIARKHFFRKDFDSCLPVLRKIMAFDHQSSEASQARIYLMDVFYFQGMDNLNLGNYEGASRAFYEALQTMQSMPELDPAFFAKLAQNAVRPFMKYGQQLFLMDKDYGLANQYFQAVTWLVPGSSESFLAKEYMKEIAKLNGTVKNPVIYMSNLVAEESKKFMDELQHARDRRRLETMRQ